MTGRDLIIYILENELEDEPVFKDGKFIGFLTIEEVAIRMNVGTATVKALYELHALRGVQIGDTLFIYDTDDINRPKLVD